MDGGRDLWRFVAIARAQAETLLKLTTVRSLHAKDSMRRFVLCGSRRMGVAQASLTLFFVYDHHRLLLPCPITTHCTSTNLADKKAIDARARHPAENIPGQHLPGESAQPAHPILTPSEKWLWQRLHVAEEICTRIPRQTNADISPVFV